VPQVALALCVLIRALEQRAGRECGEQREVAGVACVHAREDAVDDAQRVLRPEHEPRKTRAR
jgi:hypothetical protein